MKPENLLANLANPQPDIRLSVVRVLGMVEETTALTAIGEQYKVESDPTVKQALAWAGKRIHTAAQSGRSTTDAIFEHFNINKEIEHAIAEQATDTEAELLKKMDEELQLEMLRRQKSASQSKATMAAAAGLAGAALGGASMATGMMGSILQPGAEAASSNIGAGRPQIGQTRAPAIRPGDTNIDIWLKRLLESADVDTRLKAARELENFNNPAALPHLATVFINDTSGDVRKAACNTGQTLYLNAVYWHMEQDGTLEAEIKRRKEALLQTMPPPQPPAPEQPLPQPPAPEPPAAPSQQSALEDLLRKSRAKRKGQQQ